MKSSGRIKFHRKLSVLQIERRGVDTTFPVKQKASLLVGIEEDVLDDLGILEKRMLGV